MSWNYSCWFGDIIRPTSSGVAQTFPVIIPRIHRWTSYFNIAHEETNQLLRPPMIARCEDAGEAIASTQPSSTLRPSLRASRSASLVPRKIWHSFFRWNPSPSPCNQQGFWRRIWPLEFPQQTVSAHRNLFHLHSLFLPYRRQQNIWC
jgi:hypothetical protein